MLRGGAFTMPRAMAANRYAQRLEDAQFQQPLEELDEQIERLSARAEAADRVGRLRLVAETVRARIENVDPLLVTGGQISELQRALTSAGGVAASIALEGDDTVIAQQFDGLDAHVDEILHKLAAWPAATPAKQAAATRKALDQISSAASRGSTQIEARTSAMEQRANEVTTAVDQQKAAVDEVLGQVRSQQAEAETQFDDHESRLTAALAQYQSNFDTQQQERTNQFAGELDGQRKKLDETLNDLKTTSQTRTDELISQATQNAAAIEEKLATAESVVGLITQTSMTGTYTKFANDEDKIANRWRSGVVVTGILFVAGLSWLLWYEEARDLKAVTNPSKFALALAIGALASYCARQAAAHRRAARHARSLQLALSALPAYLEEIGDAAKRREMLEAFAYYFFSRDLPHGKGEDVYQPADSWKSAFYRRFVGKQPPKPPPAE